MTKADPTVRLAKSRVVRGALMVAGTISLGLGIIGIFLPLLPTTPFLLLAAACYARSSERFYNWLMNNKRFGPYIRDYREGRGIPMKVKVMAITFLWATILTSIFFFLENLYIRIALMIIAVAVTVHLLTLPTKK